MFFIYWQEERLSAIFFQSGLFLLLLILSFVDLKEQIVPNVAHFLLAFLIVLDYQGLIFHLQGGLVLFLPLFCLACFAHEGIGGGDVKLLGSLGFVLGWQAILLIFSYAIFLSLPVALYLKYWKGKEGLPFVPFIAVATGLYFYLPTSFGY